MYAEHPPDSSACGAVLVGMLQHLLPGPGQFLRNTHDINALWSLRKPTHQPCSASAQIIKVPLTSFSTVGLLLPIKPVDLAGGCFDGAAHHTDNSEVALNAETCPDIGGPCNEHRQA